MLVDIEPKSSYSLRSMVGGRGRFESGESRLRWWASAGNRVSAFGIERDVFEALREGGPTKSAGAGRRLVCVLVTLSLVAIVSDLLGASGVRPARANELDIMYASMRTIR